MARRIYRSYNVTRTNHNTGRTTRSTVHVRDNYAFWSSVITIIIVLLLLGRCAA